MCKVCFCVGCGGGLWRLTCGWRTLLWCLPRSEQVERFLRRFSGAGLRRKRQLLSKRHECCGEEHSCTSVTEFCDASFGQFQNHISSESKMSGLFHRFAESATALIRRGLTVLLAAVAKRCDERNKYVQIKSILSIWNISTGDDAIAMKRRIGWRL